MKNVSQRTILSLCDYTGEWPKPYRDAGYKVIQYDTKLSKFKDIRMLHSGELGPIHGILAAPPCQDFTNASSRYWHNKDRDGRTLRSLALVDACIRIITVTQPVWWALENPVGRLNRWLGKPTMYFNPYDFGDPYQKSTALWGTFNIPEKNPVEPTDDWLFALGGNRESTREKRARTPPGFAAAFYLANP